MEPKRMSDESVKKATGKVWAEWFTLLDKADAAKMTHKEIAEYLSAKQHVPDWWSQMVTVTYEQEKGRRKLNQRVDGQYEISASKTIDAPLAKVFTAWTDDTIRTKWLQEPIIIHKANLNKSLRITWIDGKKAIDVGFYAKGDKTQVALGHAKIPSAKKAGELKKFWKDALENLASQL